MGLLETKTRESSAPRAAGGLSSFRNRELFESGNYELKFEREDITPTASGTGMFIVTSAKPGKYKHYLVKTNLTTDSVEIVKAINKKLKEEFPVESSLYTEETAYKLVIPKDQYKDSMVSTDTYSARNGYKIRLGDVTADFERAREKELIPLDAKAEDYVLLSKDREVAYFNGYAPGNRKVYREAAALREAEYVPFIRTFHGRLYIEDRGSVVAKTKPDSRYQIYQEVGDGKIHICDIVTDRRGIRSIDTIKAGKDIVPESVAEYLLSIFAGKY